MTSVLLYILCETDPPAATSFFSFIGQALVNSIIPCIVASLVARHVATNTIRADEQRGIHDQVTKLIEIAIQHPRLENKTICDVWPDGNMTEDEKIQYDNYCCLCFNLLERVWRFHDGNHARIRDFISIDELVWNHSVWWLSEKNNADGYKAEFRSFISDVIRQQSEMRGKEANVEKSSSN